MYKENDGIFIVKNINVDMVDLLLLYNDEFN